MKIADIRILPLIGEASDEMWTSRFSREENLHTLVEVITDEGVTGLGSVFTSGKLVDGAMDLLRPLLIGASALDPAAVTEVLHQNTFWQGRGGSITHAISGIDIALWDLFGKVTGQPVSRLLGGRHRESIKPYGSMLMVEPGPMRDRLQEGLARGFQAFKIGWGPFGRVDARTDEAIVAAARDAVGPDVEIMVDAGGSDAFWPHGYKWAITAARMLANYDVRWFEEALRPDDLEGYVRLTEHSPVPIAAGEVLTRRQSFLDGSSAGRSTTSSRTSPRSAGSASSTGSASTPTTTRSCSSRTAGTRRSAWPPTCNWSPRPATPAGWSTSRRRPTSRTCSRSRSGSTPTGGSPSPTGPASASRGTPTASPSIPEGCR